MENLGGCKVWRKEGLDRVRRNRGKDEVKKQNERSATFFKGYSSFYLKSLTGRWLVHYFANGF